MNQLQADKFKYQRTFGPQPRYPLVEQYPASDNLIAITGPCSIENEVQTRQIAQVLADCQVTYMRGGVYRAGTYPSDQFGFRKDLLKMWCGIARENGLKIIVEILDIRQIEDIDQYADAFQVGARHMQDYALLTELSKTTKLINLKNGLGNTLDEILGALEYLAKGHCKPVFTLRGMSTFHNHVRWDLPISIIPAFKQITGIPILIDPSHGTGRRDLVRPMALAGIAAGADGYLIEVHTDPDKSISDAEQAYPLSKFAELDAEITALKGHLMTGIPGRKEK